MVLLCARKWRQQWGNTRRNCPHYCFRGHERGDEGQLEMGFYFSGRNNRYLVLKIIAPAGIRISNPYFFFKGPRFYPCFRHIHFSFLLQNGIFFGLPYPHTIGGWNHYSLLRKRQDYPMIIYLCRPANPMPNIVFSHSIFWDAPIDDLAVERI